MGSGGRIDQMREHWHLVYSFSVANLSALRVNGEEMQHFWAGREPMTEFTWSKQNSILVSSYVQRSGENARKKSA